MNLTRGINLKKISEAMPGASGAEVKVRKRGPERTVGCLCHGEINIRTNTLYIMLFQLETFQSVCISR